MGRARRDGESFSRYKERLKEENKLDKMRQSFFRVFKNQYGMVKNTRYKIGRDGELRRVGARR